MTHYDHSSMLKYVAESDRVHVNSMLDKLDAYVQSGGKESLGDFLTALVIGDLAEATAHTDETNIKYLRQYVQYLHCRVPMKHVNLGREALRVIREVRKDGPISQAMVTRAMNGFEPRLRALIKTGG